MPADSAIVLERRRERIKKWKRERILKK